MSRSSTAASPPSREALNANVFSSSSSAHSAFQKWRYSPTVSIRRYCPGTSVVSCASNVTADARSSTSAAAASGASGGAMTEPTTIAVTAAPVASPPIPMPAHVRRRDGPARSGRALRAISRVSARRAARTVSSSTRDSSIPISRTCSISCIALLLRHPCQSGCSVRARRRELATNAIQSGPHGSDRHAQRSGDLLIREVAPRMQQQGCRDPSPRGPRSAGPALAERHRHRSATRRRPAESPRRPPPLMPKPRMRATAALPQPDGSSPPWSRCRAARAAPTPSRGRTTNAAGMRRGTSHSEHRRRRAPRPVAGCTHRRVGRAARRSRRRTRVLRATAG